MPHEDEQLRNDGAEASAIEPPPFLLSQRPKSGGVIGRSVRRRRGWWLTAAALTTVCVAVAILITTRDSPDNAQPKPAHNGPRTGIEAQVFEVTSRFADALDELDVDKLAAAMCEVDRDAYLDYFPQSEVDAGGVEDPAYEGLDVSDVEIRGVVARATVQRPGGKRLTFYYRQEDETWLVCTDAEQEFADSPATPPSTPSESSPTS